MFFLNFVVWFKTNKAVILLQRVNRKAGYGRGFTLFYFTGLNLSLIIKVIRAATSGDLNIKLQSKYYF